MTTDINAKYVLAQDGMSMYYLANLFKNNYWNSGTTVYANGEPMTALNITGWWGTTVPGPHEIVIHMPKPDRVLGYALTDPTAESERFPNSLTREQFNERADRSDIWHEMYKAIREPADPEIITIPGPWIVLEDAPLPPADSSPSWQASLPTALTQRPEYRHLFPGYLHGLRAHLVHVIKAMPHVTYVFDKDRKLDVTLEVPLELPELEWVTPINLDRRRRPKPYQRQVKITRRLSLPVPDRVPGPNYAAALQVWDVEIERWTGIVASASAKGCNTCHGRGYITTGGEEHPRTPN